MVCQDCGYVLAPFETSCPRCARLKALKQTRRLPDLKSMVTQKLVKLEQCPECKFMLFPGDTHCTSCGAAVRSHSGGTLSAQARNRGTATRSSPKTPLILGVVVSVVTLGIVLYLFRFYLPR